MKGKSFLLIFGLAVLFFSCGPSVKLTGSWSDRQIPPARFSKILVLAIGKDLEKRKLAEDKLKSELGKRGIVGISAIDEFGPDLAKKYDSAGTRQMLQERQFDACLTIRVVNIEEHDRWVPAGGFYGPEGFYRGFYGYYYRVYGYYGEPGYRVSDVEVLLESNLYVLQSGELLWSGQSKAFSRNPTPSMAARYAKNILDDMIDKKVIIP